MQTFQPITETQTPPPTVDKSTLGLNNVNNTADTDKPVSSQQQQAIDGAEEAAIAAAPDTVQQNLGVPIDENLLILNEATGLYDRIQESRLDVTKFNQPNLAMSLVNNATALATLQAYLGSAGSGGSGGGGGGGGTTPVTVTRFSSIANNDGANPITYFAAASPVPSYFQGTSGVGAESGGNAGLLNLKLAAGADGYVEFQYYATDGIYSHIGFNESGGTAQARNLLEAGIFVEDGGKIGTIDKGVLTLSTTTLPLGGRLRCGRVNSVFKVWVVSADRATVTDFLTLTYTSAAALSCGLSISDNKKLYDGLGGNLQPV